MDAEPLAIATAATQETPDIVLLLTDSQAALQRALNLGRGSPPRPRIEKDLKGVFRQRAHLDIAIPSLDRQSHSQLRQPKGRQTRYLPGALRPGRRHHPKSTEEGIRAPSRATGKEARHKEGFGQMTVCRPRQELPRAPKSGHRVRFPGSSLS